MIVVEDDMMDKFQVGDIVRLSLDDVDVYSYDIPKAGTLGIISVQSHSLALEQSLGVKIPISLVQWEDGQKIVVFSHDLTKVPTTEELIERIKNTLPYTGEKIN